MPDVLFIDTETGGLNPDIHPLLEVGWALVEGEAVTRQGAFYLKGEHGAATPEALAKNGLDLEVVNVRGLEPRHAWKTLLAEVSHLSRPPRFGGYNTPFDRSFLLKLELRALEDDPSHPDLTAPARADVDLRPVVSFLKGLGLIRMKDGTLSEAYQAVTGEQHVGAHRALADALATARMYLELKKRLTLLP